MVSERNQEKKGLSIYLWIKIGREGWA